MPVMHDILWRKDYYEEIKILYLGQVLQDLIGKSVEAGAVTPL